MSMFEIYILTHVERVDNVYVHWFTALPSFLSFVALGNVCSISEFIFCYPFIQAKIKLCCHITQKKNRGNIMYALFLELKVEELLQKYRFCNSHRINT